MNSDAYKFSVRDSTEFRVNSSELFVITLTPNSEEDFNGVMDKTAGEIQQAYMAGKMIIARIPNFAGLETTEVFMAGMTKDPSNECIAIHFEIINLIGDAAILKVITWGDSADTARYSCEVFPLGTPK